MLSHDFCWCSLNHGPVKPLSWKRHTFRTEVWLLLCHFCAAFPFHQPKSIPVTISGSSGSTRSPKASKKIGRGSAPGAGANAAICRGSSFNHRARCSSPASVHRSLRPVNRSDVRRFSYSAAVSGKRTAPVERPVGRLSITLNFQPTIFRPCFHLGRTLNHDTPLLFLPFLRFTNPMASAMA